MQPNNQSSLCLSDIHISTCCLISKNHTKHLEHSNMFIQSKWITGIFTAYSNMRLDSADIKWNQSIWWKVASKWWKTTIFSIRKSMVLCHLSSDSNLFHLTIKAESRPRWLLLSPDILFLLFIYIKTFIDKYSPVHAAFVWSKLEVSSVYHIWLLCWCSVIMIYQDICWWVYAMKNCWFYCC